jgi:hypothetical protein
MNDNWVTVLRFSPGKNPEIAEIEKSVDALNKEVSFGSYYECDAVPLELEQGIHMVYNQEAPLLGLKGNRKVLDKIISGTFLIVATDDKGYITSLTSRQINKYGLRYWDIEEYSDDEISYNYFYAPIDACAV